MNRLQAAAQQYLDESFEDSSSGPLIQASEEIAQQRGLESPSPRRPLREGLSRQSHQYFSNSTPKIDEEENEDTLPITHGIKTHDDSASKILNDASSEISAPQVETQMKLSVHVPTDIVHISSAQLDIDASTLVAAVTTDPTIDSSGKPLPPIKTAHESLETDVEELVKNASNEVIRGQDTTGRYAALTEKLKKRNASVHAEKQPRLPQPKYSLVSEPSKIAQYLDKAQDRPWAENVRSKFGSYQQEMMFRNMRQVMPTSSRSGSRGDSDSKGVSDHKSQRGATPTRPQSGNAGTSRIAEAKAMRVPRQSLERLCKPVGSEPSLTLKKMDPTLRYSTLDDAKNCTFKPQLKARPGEQGHDPDAKSNFIERQEAEERSRREDREFHMGKADYDAMVDKKQCPICGSKQSYDEVKEKRKKCPNCQKEYVYKLQWGKVGGQFFDRVKEHNRRTEEKKQKIVEDSKAELRQIERRKVDKGTGKIIIVQEQQDKQWDTETEQAFFDRMSRKLIAREKRLAEVEAQTYSTCTFKPELKTTAPETDDDFDIDNPPDPAKAFLQRMQSHHDNHRANNPHLYNEKKHQTTNKPFKA